jgi:predicted porin
MQAAADTPLGNVGSKFDATVYGYIKLDASYDTQRSQGDLAFWVMPECDDGKDDEFNMTARQTRLGLKLGGPEVLGGTISGRLETDFYGQGAGNNKADIRMRLAYVDWAFEDLSIRAGQDWDTFIIVLPKTVDFATLGNVGRVGFRRPQFRISGVLPLAEQTKMIAKVAAARTIAGDLDTGGQTDGSDSGVPTFQGNLMIETMDINEKPIKLGVSGFWGQMTADEVVSNVVVRVDSKDYDTWLLMGSLSLPFNDYFGVNAVGWTGENLDNVYGGIGQGINFAQDKVIKSKGGWVQALVNITPQFNINVGYGVDDPDDDDLNIGNRELNTRIFANAFYSFDPAMTVALEYSHMKTEYKCEGDTENADNDRVQAAAIYTF